MILLQRLCWNTNSWRGPTGSCYMREDSWVGEHGFGLEEWNFNTNDLVDDVVYGYLYYTPPLWNPAREERNDIYFFALTPSGERKLVGAYRSAEFISQAEKDNVKSKFLKTGIFDRRIDELLALELSSIPTSTIAQQLLVKDFALNVKVASQDIEVYDPYRDLRPEDVGGRNPGYFNRYTRPVELNSPPLGQLNNEISADTTLPEGSDKGLLTHPYLRYTWAQQQIIRRHHASLSNRFRAWLRNAGATDILAESEYADVICCYRGLRYLFELKICYQKNARRALREALGQLLDYAFYPGHRHVDRIAIVLDYAPSQLDIDWVRSLSGMGLNIDIFWFRGQTLQKAGSTDSPLAQKSL